APRPGRRAAGPRGPPRAGACPAPGPAPRPARTSAAGRRGTARPAAGTPRPAPQPRFAPGDGRDRRRDPLLADVRERREYRPLHDAGDQTAVRDKQDVPGIFRTGVGRVPQCEVKTVDLRGRVEAVKTALVPAELDRDQHVAELVRRPRADLDRLPHPHRAELGQPWPVAVGREPDVRVTVEVGLELL